MHTETDSVVCSCLEVSCHLSAYCIIMCIVCCESQQTGQRSELDRGVNVLLLILLLGVAKVRNVHILHIMDLESIRLCLAKDNNDYILFTVWIDHQWMLIVNGIFGVILPQWKYKMFVSKPQNLKSKTQHISSFPSFSETITVLVIFKQTPLPDHLYSPPFFTLGLTLPCSSLPHHPRISVN